MLLYFRNHKRKPFYYATHKFILLDQIKSRILVSQVEIKKL